MTIKTSSPPRDPIYSLALKIRQDLATFSHSERSVRVVDILGCLLAWTGRQFSQAMEDSRLQAVQLEKLEVLGRAILAAIRRTPV